MENPQLDQTVDEDTTRAFLKQQQFNGTNNVLTTDASLREPLLKHEVSED